MITQNKKLPFFFLALLLLLLSFILGVQYGKKVEKIDRKNLESLSATKSISITNEASPTIFYKLFEHEGCLVAFQIPSNFEIIKESLNGASLSSKADKIELNCEDSEFPTKNATYIKKAKIASQSANLFTFETENKKRYEFTFQNSKKASVNFYVDEPVYKLVSESLKLIK